MPAAPVYQNFEKLFIDGRWKEGGARPRPNLSPWTEQAICDAPQANAEDLDAAYGAARKAQPQWAAKLPSERAQVFAKMAQLMDQRRDEIIGWIVREAGGTLLKGALEWKSVQGVMLEAASLPYMVEGRIMPNDTPGKESRVYRRPVGVVGVISPWNWPFQLSVRRWDLRWRAANEGDAMRIANDTDYGLSSSVFTKDLEKGVRFARSIEAGMAHVNDQPVNDLPFHPFGGEKNSGIGRFNGRWAVDAFTTDQWVTLQHKPRPYPNDARALSPGSSENVGG